jgi:hypothetical protein
MNSQSGKRAGEKYLPVVHSSLCHGNIISVHDLFSINLSSFSVLFLHAFSSFSFTSSCCCKCFSCHFFYYFSPPFIFLFYVSSSNQAHLSLSPRGATCHTSGFPIFIVCFRKKRMDLLYRMKDSKFWSRLTWISWFSRVPTMHICYMP